MAPVHCSLQDLYRVDSDSGLMAAPSKKMQDSFTVEKTTWITAHHRSHANNGKVI
jgi:hypothetical protein